MCSGIPLLRSSSTFSNVENTIKIILLHCNITYLTQTQNMLQSCSTLTTWHLQTEA